MPTGYTAGVADGSITSFKQFALQCARGFGACIEMRDDPIDASIPEEFKATSYYAEKLADAQARLANLEKMTDRDVSRAADADFEEEMASYRKTVADNDAKKARYAVMLAQATAWMPPTPDHAPLKQFMIEQITQSITWDCGLGWLTLPVRKTEAGWRAAAIADAQRDVARYGKLHREEIEGVSKRNAWIKALRQSL